MFRGIVVYFLLVFCLLTKDGLSLALDILCEKSSISLEISLEDSLEEDGSDDLFASEDFGLQLNQNHNDSLVERTIPDHYSESALNVLLEQLSPPPRMA
jgi:hypothetical protein